VLIKASIILPYVYTFCSCLYLIKNPDIVSVFSTCRRTTLLRFQTRSGYLPRSTIRYLPTCSGMSFGLENFFLCLRKFDRFQFLFPKVPQHCSSPHIMVIASSFLIQQLLCQSYNILIFIALFRRRLFRDELVVLVQVKIMAL
jgi:hypothetical protein